MCNTCSLLQRRSRRRNCSRWKGAFHYPLNFLRVEIVQIRAHLERGNLWEREASCSRHVLLASRENLRLIGHVLKLAENTVIAFHKPKNLVLDPGLLAEVLDQS
jgi:hypothetical protein